MEDNTIKDLVSDMLSNVVLGDKPEEEQVTSTGLMSSLPGFVLLRKHNKKNKKLHLKLEIK